MLASRRQKVPVPQGAPTGNLLLRGWSVGLPWQVFRSWFPAAPTSGFSGFAFCGRDPAHAGPPAQIRTSETIAYGSCLG